MAISLTTMVGKTGSVEERMKQTGIQSGQGEKLKIEKGVQRSDGMTTMMNDVESDANTTAVKSSNDVREKGRESKREKNGRGNRG